jgi:hypothetical protein
VVPLIEAHPNKFPPKVFSFENFFKVHLPSFLSSFFIFILFYFILFFLFLIFLIFYFYFIFLIILFVRLAHSSHREHLWSTRTTVILWFPLLTCTRREGRGGREGKRREGEGGEREKERREGERERGGGSKI